MSRVDTERWQVHKYGCAEVARLRRSETAVNAINAASPEELIQSELAGELSEAGYTADDFRIMPCLMEWRDYATE